MEQGKKPVEVRNADDVLAGAEAHINEYLFVGGPDREAEDVAAGERFGIAEAVMGAWANAREKARVEAVLGGDFCNRQVGLS